MHWFALRSNHTRLRPPPDKPAYFFFCTKWDYKDGDPAALVTVYFRATCHPMSSLLNFLLSVTMMVVWTDYSRRQTTPFQSMVSPAARSAGPVTHLGAWWCSYLVEDIVFFNSLKQNPSPARLFYWFGRPRVERWRTSKQCSPMSVIWWRWRRANLLQRPGRVRKSSCLSPGNHIY